MGFIARKQDLRRLDTVVCEVIESIGEFLNVHVFLFVIEVYPIDRPLVDLSLVEIHTIQNETW